MDRNLEDLADLYFKKYGRDYLSKEQLFKMYENYVSDRQQSLLSAVASTMDQSTQSTGGYTRERFTKFIRKSVSKALTHTDLPLYGDVLTTSDAVRLNVGHGSPSVSLFRH